METIWIREKRIKEPESAGEIKGEQGSRTIAFIL